MKSKKTIAGFLIAVMSTHVYALGDFNEDLGGTANATDIVLFKCSTQVGIDRAKASIRDVNPPNAAANLNVQIAKATSATTCPATNGVGWTTVKTTSGESTWSLFTADISVNQTSPNNYYCVKVTKTGAAAERYTVDSICGKLGSLPFPPVPYFGSQPSTFVKKILDQ